MDFKLVLLLSALGLACAASIQDPYIHDSDVDQIAMESGPQRSVVVAPPHLQTDIKITSAAPDVAVAVQAQQLEDGEEEKEEKEEKEEVAVDAAADVSKADAPFTVIVNDKPAVSAAPLPHSRPSFTGFAVRRPALPPLAQMSLLSRLQPQLQFGAPLGGYGGSPIILLQPIIVPVPMSAAEAGKKSSALTEEVMSSLLRRASAQPRPVTLMDLLQRGYYAY